MSAAAYDTGVFGDVHLRASTAGGMQMKSFASPGVSPTITRGGPSPSAILIILVAAMAAILLGGLLALSAYKLVAGLIAVGAGIALLLFPRAAVWVALAGAATAAGLVELYLPQLQFARWGFAILSLGLAAVALVRRMFGRIATPADATGVGALACAIIVFALAGLISCIAGGLSTTAAAVGLKNYFQMWGVFLAFAWFGYRADEARRFIKFLAMLALIQLPFVLHQFLILVPQRSTVAAAEDNIVAVDIVAGTFGGSMLGGGRSADLAVLVVIAIALFAAEYRLHQRTKTSAILLSAVAFLPIMLNEAKLALVLLPAALAFVFGSAIMRRPVAAFLSSLALIALLSSLVAVYSMLPGADAQRKRSVGEFIEESLSYNIGDKGYGSAKLNRTTVYSFWWKENIGRHDVRGALFGHGLGSTNSFSQTAGRETLAYARYPGYSIGLTGLSSLLWETGLLGAGALIGILLAAYRLSGRLLKSWRGGSQAAALITARASLAVLGISLLHNNYITFDLGYQAMFVIVIGYLLAVARLKPEVNA